jgi:predicted nucleotidyltransferase
MDRGVFLAHIRRTRFAPGDRENAQADARRIADFLREQGASRVVGIGSAFAPNRRFTKRSDIDLVVEGLPPRRFFRALAEAADTTAFALDLTPAESATDYMRQAVDEEGVDL